MPVEITFPLTPLEQAVYDARENEKVMAAKVEDAKLVLKAVKTAWEEAVGAEHLALDEMIADKRQPRLPFDEAGDEDDKAGGPTEPTSPAPAGDDVASGHAVVTIVPTKVEIEPPDVFEAPGTELLALPSANTSHVTGAKNWRDMAVADEIDGPSSLFDVFAVFKVETMGQLADALVAGRTFNLASDQIRDLQGAIEDASADDEVPVKFDRDVELNLTVKEPEQGEQPEPVVQEEEEATTTKKGRGRGRAKKDKVANPPVTESAPAPDLDGL